MIEIGLLFRSFSNGANYARDLLSRLLKKPMHKIKRKKRDLLLVCF